MYQKLSDYARMATFLSIENFFVMLIGLFDRDQVSVPLIVFSVVRSCRDLGIGLKLSCDTKFVAC